MSYRLDPFRDPILRSYEEAEADMVASLRRGYRDAWAQVKANLPAPHLVTKAAGLGDARVIGGIVGSIETAFAGGRAAAAAALVSAENDWFERYAYRWTRIEVDALLARYETLFAEIGGFVSVGDNATKAILAALADFYGDNTMSLLDLEAKLSPWFSPEKAYQVGVTETTRLGTANTLLVADRTGAGEYDWDDSNDILVCTACSTLAGDSPYSLSRAEYPPAHTGCRCRLALLLPDGVVADEIGG